MNHLPPESFTITAIRNSVTPEMAAMAAPGNDPCEAQWSQMEMLLATSIDEQRNMRYLYTSAHSEKRPGPPPEPIPRPGVKGKPKRKVMTDEQRAILDPRLRANLRAVPDMPDDTPPPEVTID